MGKKKTKTLKKPRRALPEVAFYYPGPMWRSGDWIKNLLLFFDGVALLVPEYLENKPERVDPAVAVPLREAGLLHLLKPERAVDALATQALATGLVPIIESGALDTLANDKGPFHELSFSRLGGYGDPGLASELLGMLKAKGLARDTEDGLSIPMHPFVRTLVLVLLAQILRPYGKQFGLELFPTTDRSDLVGSLVQVLSLTSTPSTGQVVAFDLETVGVDLSRVPLDEVLGFRKEHLKEYKSYARALRRFAREVSLLPEGERPEAFKDRQAEIRDRAQDLKDAGRKAWKAPASFALSIAAAAWTLKTGDPIGAVLAAASAGVGYELRGRTEVGAYSYLFRASERYA